MAEMMSGLVVGDPADPDTEVGPLVSQRQQHRVQDYIRSGVAEGAKIVLGGDDSPDAARLVRSADAVHRVRPTT